VLLRRWWLDRRVVKGVSGGRLLLHRCVWGAIITGIRAGAGNNWVQVRMRPVVVVLLLSLLERRVLVLISTVQ